MLYKKSILRQKLLIFTPLDLITRDVRTLLHRAFRIHDRKKFADFARINSSPPHWQIVGTEIHTVVHWLAGVWWHFQHNLRLYCAFKSYSL